MTVSLVAGSAAVAVVVSGSSETSMGLTATGSIGSNASGTAAAAVADSSPSDSRFADFLLSLTSLASSFLAFFSSDFRAFSASLSCSTSN